MTTSSTRRVTVTAVDVEDATAYLRVEGGGKFDVSISGTYVGTVVLEYRTPPGGSARTRKTYTADTEFEEMLEVEARWTFVYGCPPTPLALRYLNSPWVRARTNRSMYREAFFEFLVTPALLWMRLVAFLLDFEYEDSLELERVDPEEE